MKRSALLAAAAASLFVTSGLFAQDRRPGSSDGGRGAPGNSVSTAPSVSQAPSVSMGGSTRGSYSDSPSYIPRGGGYYGGGGAVAAPTPNLTGTSFYSSTIYFNSQNYHWYLWSRYGFSPFYFRRFYRNVEPLVNPYIASHTLREPLALSTRMLASIDDLEAMVRDRQAGKEVPKVLIEDKAEEIRDLAKQIRQDASVSYFEHRKDRNLLKGLNDLDTLEAIAQLRAFATDLNTQLKGLYSNAQPVVTVDTLAQPSFQSLSKGIEKLTKSIESSANRI